MVAIAELKTSIPDVTLVRQLARLIFIMGDSVCPLVQEPMIDRLIWHGGTK